MNVILDRLGRRLEQLKLDANFRSLPGTAVGVDFWSNDYLGVARDLSGVRSVAGGSTGSRLISGDRSGYREIEARIANAHVAPGALVFTSGYAANLGLLSALSRRGDTVLYDQLVHASLRDGIRLGMGKAYSFRHNDLDHLERRLRSASGPAYVVTEAVFSMDGDQAPLPAIVNLCERYGAALIVDEAHSAGLYGPAGAGLVVAHGLEERVLARVITYGKAYGVHGAAIVGSEKLIQYLINHARSFIFSTGPSPHQWASIRAAYDLLEREGDARRDALWQNVTYWRDRGGRITAAAPFDSLTLKSEIPLPHPIQVIKCAGNSAVLERERQLREAGLLVKAIRHPTVAAGTERIRICLHAFNTSEEIDSLAKSLDHAD